MEIKIFDVERGFCALVIADNKHAALIDCGSHISRGFRPSDYILKQNYSGIEQLIFSVYNDESLADLPNLLGNHFQSHFPTKFLIKNPAINSKNSPELAVRSNGIKGRLNLLSALSNNYTEKVGYHGFGGISFAFFCNNYPEFLDLDNLSLVTFLSCRDINIVFPGNINKNGWHSLLKSSSFREHLQRVNLFVASNHGRESGYCSELFNYCQPELVVISDEFSESTAPAIENLYKSQAKGYLIGSSEQKVLTTQRHGTITISQPLGKRLKITTNLSRVKTAY